MVASLSFTMPTTGPDYEVVNLSRMYFKVFNLFSTSKDLKAVVRDDIKLVPSVYKVKHACMNKNLCWMHPQRRYSTIYA